MQWATLQAKNEAPEPPLALMTAVRRPFPFLSLRLGADLLGHPLDRGQDLAAFHGVREIIAGAGLHRHADHSAVILDRGDDDELRPLGVTHELPKLGLPELAEIEDQDVGRRVHPV